VTAFLEYIRNGGVWDFVLMKSHAVSLMKLAIKYEMLPLMRDAELIICTTLNDERVCDALTLCENDRCVARFPIFLILLFISVLKGFTIVVLTTLTTRIETNLTIS
jgi:hypothetical protein